MKKYFTPLGSKRLIVEKKAALDNLEQVQKQKQPATEDGATWHDNPEFEDLVRKESMINEQIRQYNEQIAGINIVDRPTDMDRLRIGHQAVITVDGEKRNIVVGGFGDTTDKVEPEILAYNVPLILQLIGQEEGALAKVKGPKGNFFEVELVRIEGVEESLWEK